MKLNSPESDLRLERRIDYLISDADIEAALTVLREGLKAEKSVRQRAGGGEGTRYMMVPDHHVRHASARLIVEYAFGKATQQIEVAVNHNQTMAPAEVAKRILNSGVDVAGVMETYFSSMRHVRSEPPGLT